MYDFVTLIVDSRVGAS